MFLKKAGIVIIIIGILMMAYTDFNFVTTGKVVDLGPIQINQEKNHPVQWSPVIGALFLVGGIIMVIFAKKARN